MAPEYELSDGDFFDLARTEEAKKPSKSQLAIEALKASILEEAARVTRGNEVRSKLFSERINELMLKYTNKQLTAAEVIARL
ncbi:MAG: type I restriction enzyme endonuclease domain-containing protein, partial [Brachybacterium alimentarium]